MDQRIKAIAARCRNRGGDCPCGVSCEGIREAEKKLDELALAQTDLAREYKQLEGVIRRLRTPPATLKDGFQFDPNLQPVAVMDGDEAHFGYEDEDGEWTDMPWPFNESWIWPDDCERHGIRVE